MSTRPKLLFCTTLLALSVSTHAVQINIAGSGNYEREAYSTTIDGYDQYGDANINIQGTAYTISDSVTMFSNTNTSGRFTDPVWLRYQLGSRSHSYTIDSQTGEKQSTALTGNLWISLDENSVTYYSSEINRQGHALEHLPSIATATIFGPASELGYFHTGGDAIAPSDGPYPRSFTPPTGTLYYNTVSSYIPSLEITNSIYSSSELFFLDLIIHNLASGYEQSLLSFAESATFNNLPLIDGPLVPGDFNNTYGFELYTTEVPLPASAWLLSSALALLAASRRKKTNTP